jgi:hypothetical protein
LMKKKVVKTELISFKEGVLGPLLVKNDWNINLFYKKF